MFLEGTLYTQHILLKEITKAMQITLQRQNFFPRKTLQPFSAWLYLSPSRVALLLFHCSVVLKPLRINGFHLVSVFFPLSCGSEQEVEHNELVNEGSLKQRFIQRLPFRLQLWIPYHTLPHALKSKALMSVCVFQFFSEVPTSKGLPNYWLKKMALNANVAQSHQPF